MEKYQLIPKTKNIIFLVCLDYNLPEIKAFKAWVKYI